MGCQSAYCGCWDLGDFLEFLTRDVKDFCAIADLKDFQMFVGFWENAMEEASGALFFELFRYLDREKFGRVGIMVSESDDSHLWRRSNSWVCL